MQCTAVGRTLEIDAGAERLDQLYRRFSRRVRWVARARGVPESALDDVVHDVFLRIFRKLRDRDADVPLASWVDAIARNVAFSHRRTSARRVLRDATASAPAALLSPDEALARKDAWRALQQFLEALDPEQREAFVLCDVLQTPVPEIARTTEVKLNTVYSRVRLARRRFAQTFGDPPDSTMLRKAIEHERRGPARSRRAIALLLADLGLVSPAATATATAIGLGGVWKATIAAAAIAITGIGGAAVATRPATSHSVSSPPSASSRSRPRPPTTLASSDPPNSTSSASPPPSRPEPGPTRTPVRPPSSPGPLVESPPSPLDPPVPAPAELQPQTPDPLAVEVALLARARAHLGRGRPTDALRLVEEHRSRFPQGALQPQRRGIERDAACAAGDAARAQRAARALGTDDLGPVCKGSKKASPP